MYAQVSQKKTKKTQKTTEKEGFLGKLNLKRELSCSLYK